MIRRIAFVSGLILGSGVSALLLGELVLWLLTGQVVILSRSPDHKIQTRLLDLNESAHLEDPLQEASTWSGRAA